MGSMLGSIFSTGYNAAASAARTAVNAGKYVGGKVVDGAKYVAETAVGVTTALVGAPYFMILLIRSLRTHA